MKLYSLSLSKSDLPRQNPKLSCCGAVVSWAGFHFILSEQRCVIVRVRRHRRPLTGSVASLGPPDLGGGTGAQNKPAGLVDVGTITTYVHGWIFYRKRDGGIISFFFQEF